MASADQLKALLRSHLEGQDAVIHGRERIREAEIRAMIEERQAIAQRLRR